MSSPHLMLYIARSTRMLRNLFIRHLPKMVSVEAFYTGMLIGGG